MSTFNQSKQTKFTNVLKKTGRQLTFTTTSGGAYDPGLGYTPPDAAPNYVKWCVQDKYSVMEISTGAANVGDVKLIAENGDYKTGDTVSIDGAIYRIMNATPIKPAETVMVYELQVRV